jgi:hypothetical protein
MKWTLNTVACCNDCIERNRRAVLPGKVVKLSFSYSTGGGENMWLWVDDREGDNARGTLISSPWSGPADLVPGANVAFDVSEVMDVDLPVTTRRGYLKRWRGSKRKVQANKMATLNWQSFGGPSA